MDSLLKDQRVMSPCRGSRRAGICGSGEMVCGLGALERRSSVAIPSPLPLTQLLSEEDDAALEELSLRWLGTVSLRKSCHAIGFREATRSQWLWTCLTSTMRTRRRWRRPALSPLLRRNLQRTSGGGTGRP